MTHSTPSIAIEFFSSQLNTLRHIDLWYFLFLNFCPFLRMFNEQLGEKLYQTNKQKP